MKFDGRTYLATTANLKLKGLKGTTKPFFIAEAIKDLYDTETLDIPFGSIRYMEEKNKEYDIDLEYLQFHVHNEGSLNISQIEIGNRFSFLGFPAHTKYGILVTANFKDGNGRIKCLIDMSDKNYELAKASVIIDDKDDPYRGIYCIELKSRIDDTDKTVIEYFDGDTIDAIESVSGEYKLDDLASFSTEKLRKVGFGPDKSAVLDYWPVEEKYHTETEMVGHTFAHGTRAKFNEWVEKIFPKEETKKPEGQVLDKKFNG